MRKVLAVILFSGMVQAQDFIAEKVSGYVRGVNDTINFLEAEAKVRIPPKGYWLWLDVSQLPFWKRVAFANILKEKNGIYPAYLYNTITYQALFVVEAGKNLKALINDAKIYKNLYPTLAVDISYVENPAVFQPIVKIGICNIPKPKLSYQGIEENINSAIVIARELGDNELAKYLQKVKQIIERYEETKKIEEGE